MNIMKRRDVKYSFHLRNLLLSKLVSWVLGIRAEEKERSLTFFFLFVCVFNFKNNINIYWTFMILFPFCLFDESLIFLFCCLFFLKFFLVNCQNFLIIQIIITYKLGIVCSLKWIKIMEKKVQTIKKKKKKRNQFLFFFFWFLENTVNNFVFWRKKK